MDQTEGTANMLHLTLLPPEILHNIFQFLELQDLGRLPRTCRRLYVHVKGNHRLFRDVYTRKLDTPRSVDGIDWEKHAQDVARLSLLCAHEDSESKKDELPFVYETVNRLLKLASPTPTGEKRVSGMHQSRNTLYLRNLFKNESTIDAFLAQSFLFDRARGKKLPLEHIGDQAQHRERHQQSAKLHCLYGEPILNIGRTRSSRMYPFACSKVYDLRQYTDATMWGPFMDDGSGRVDWERVEAILIVLGSNIKTKRLVSSRTFRKIWATPFEASWAGSYAPPPRLKSMPLDLQDPYSISGSWLRIVCFLDYNDFFDYNFTLGDQPPPNVPRPALHVGEATRLILMRLRVTAIEPPGPEDGQELPVVHFKGVSKAIDTFADTNANSDLRGTVRLTKDGEVRWTTFSIFGGQERWRSEGIQIGGVRAAKGIAGNWFDVDYDPHGPCGPTAFWKLSDFREPPEDDDQVSSSDFLALLDDMAIAGDSEDDSDYEDHGGQSEEEDWLVEQEEEEVVDGNEDLEDELGMLAAAEFDFITILPEESSDS